MAHDKVYGICENKGKVEIPVNIFSPVCEMLAVLSTETKTSELSGSYETIKVERYIYNTSPFEIEGRQDDIRSFNLIIKDDAGTPEELGYNPLVLYPVGSLISGRGNPIGGQGFSVSLIHGETNDLLDFNAQIFVEIKFFKL